MFGFPCPFTWITYRPPPAKSRKGLNCDFYLFVWFIPLYCIYWRMKIWGKIANWDNVEDFILKTAATDLWCVMCACMYVANIYNTTIQITAYWLEPTTLGWKVIQLALTYMSSFWIVFVLQAGKNLYESFCHEWLHNFVRITAKKNNILSILIAARLRSYQRFWVRAWILDVGNKFNIEYRVLCARISSHTSVVK